MSTEKQLAKIEAVSLDQLQVMARSIAASKMFGVQTEDQAIALMLLCQAEGLHPVMALRRYHLIDGKPAMRADALQGDFEQKSGGAILWHERTDEECSATFFAEKKNTDGDAIERAKSRYAAIKAGNSAAEFAHPGELTIVRTLTDAVQKKVAMSWKDNGWKMKHNWAQSPRQMLHARCLTEGVRAIAPGLIAGVYTEDEIIDAPPEPGLDQRPTSEQAEASVRAATANRLENVTDAELIHEVDLHWEDVVVHFGENMKGKRLGDLEPSQIGWLQKHWEPRDNEADKHLKRVVSSLQSVPLNGESNEITEANYQDIVCHIGKAEGQMLGRKVSEIHPKILEWLDTHYGPQEEGPSWGNPPSNKDKRLKVAVEIALKSLATDTQGDDELTLSGGVESRHAAGTEHLQEVSGGTGADRSGSSDPPAQTFNWREVTVPFECRIKGEKLGDMKEGVLKAIQTQLLDKFKITTDEEKLFVQAYEMMKAETGLFMDREQLHRALIDRAEDLILTEAQLVAELREQGMLEKQETLHEASEKIMRYVLVNWNVVKAAVEEKGKPKVDPTAKPKKRAAKK